MKLCCTDEGLVSVLLTFCRLSPKGLFDGLNKLVEKVEQQMSGPPMQCPFCGKQNAPDGRYCVHCGKILRTVYCSSCGTPNPVDLPRCLECGIPLPSLGGIRWNPIVTILRPTGAMTEETEPSPPESLASASVRGTVFSRVRGGLRSKEEGKGD